MSVIVTILTTMALVLMLTLTACGSNTSASLADDCDANGEAGIGTAACNEDQVKQVGVTEAFGLLEPEGDSQKDTEDDLQASIPPLDGSEAQPVGNLLLADGLGVADAHAPIHLWQVDSHGADKQSLAFRSMGAGLLQEFVRSLSRRNWCSRLVSRR